ncbi:MAG: hypothetical protein HY048_02360 [Acidobacteria bacterium]|nr:hypothetical protein [Acidobacteriota bacterium]
MKRVLSFALACAVILPFAARAQGKTDFSGTWTLDPAKSDAPMGRGGRGGAVPAGPITMSQTASDLTQKRGEQTLTYKLDGSESKNQMQGRGGMQDVSSKAHWEGATLIIETVRDFGGMSITTKETRSLSADGKEMTVETAVSTPQGDINTKQVFTKS